MLRFILILVLLFGGPTRGFSCDGIELLLPQNPPLFSDKRSVWDQQFAHWFGGLEPRESSRTDYEFMVQRGVDPSKTMKAIGARMELFAKIIDDTMQARWNKQIRTIHLGIYELEDIGETKGLQQCPYSDTMWSGDVKVTNKRTGKSVWVNEGTAHLATEHGILEKGDGNPFATSVAVFLEHFMEDVPEFVPNF